MDEADGLTLCAGVVVADRDAPGLAETLPSVGAGVAAGGAVGCGGGAVGGRVGFGVGGLGVAAGVGVLITTLAGAVEVRLADFSPAPDPLVAVKA